LRENLGPKRDIGFVAPDAQPLSREGLYRAVWSEPVHTVAARYGVSDVGLAKLCRRHRIPLPGRGYWQQIRAGQKMRRPPLPPRDKTGPADDDIILRPVEHPATAIEPPKPERSPAPPIPVPEALTRPHPLVAQADRILRASEPDARGLLHAAGKRCLDIRVTPATLDRALLIMDTLAKALGKRGYPVSVASEHPWATVASVQDETIEFLLEERIKQVPHQPTPIEELEAKQFAWHPRKSDPAPSGDLRLHIAHARWYGQPATWADGKKGRLEQYLGEFVRGLEDVAEAIKKQRVQEAEAEHRREEERKREWERQQQRYLDERRAAELKEQAGRWREARDLQEYVAALKNAKTVMMRTEYLEIASLKEWVAWAEAYAERVDPIATAGGEDAKQS